MRPRCSRLLSASFGGLLATLLLAGCGIPGLPELPDPGEAPARAGTGTEGAVAPGGREAGAMVGGDCFQRHLREAIHLNERRAPVYAAWSEGASEPLSHRLIRSERAALVAARYVDRKARPFQEAGVPIGCVEFISMSLTPPLGSARLPPPPEPYAPGPDADSLVSALAAAYGTAGFAGVRAVAGGALDGLERMPHYHCMVRHLVESLWRVADLAPYHVAAARSKGMSTTVPLSELLVRLHLAALPEAGRLDRDAAPLQQAGVPILCRDVPPIPREPRHL